MPVLNILSNDQQMLIERISAPNTNIKRTDATVSVYLYFNRLAKPMDELRSIIEAVDPNLLSKDEVDRSLNWMVENQLAQKMHSDAVDMDYIKTTSDFEAIMERLTGVTGLADLLREKYSSMSQKVCVTPKDIVGTKPENYIEMLELIRNAREFVNYAVLNTEPYKHTVQVLKHAAEHGVNIRILVACEEITQKIKQKHSVENLWKEEFKHTPKVQIKVFEDLSAVELCSSVQIDNVLRLDIYDPKRVRSLDGYLIEMRNAGDENMNLIRWYMEKFEKVWNDSYGSVEERLAAEAQIEAEKIREAKTARIRWWLKLGASFAVMLLSIVAFFQWRSKGATVAQDFWDEMLLAVIVLCAEYMIKAVWDKLKHFAAAFWTVLKNTP